MTNKESSDFFVEQLLDNAVEDFKATEQYKLLRERLAQMERECETMLTAEGRAFAAECFDLIRETDGQEEFHVYRKGLTDGVQLLKWLGVLA